jgi:adenylate cyclase
MESRDADLTVMFSDLRGFTTISEKLTAKELAAYINEYLTRMSKVISDRKGTLDKFIGDAIMAFWGAPVPDAFAAANAVESAIAMQVEAAQLSREFVAKGWPEFHIGIGINTGPMRVGDMGSKLRRAYTVMGDPVNLGSRLEGLTKNYGVEIIVGEGTVALLPDYSFRLLDRVRVKGKDEAVQIYEPMGKVTGLTPDQVAELGQWQAVMDAYFVQDWDQARSLVNHCRSSGAPSGLCDLYDERIDALEQDPPGPGWDGVTKFTTK